MQIVETVAELRAAIRAAGPGDIGFAPTMGFLHGGHASLFRQAATENGLCVASIYVNPTQFGPNEDLERYPRDPDGDASKCAASGVDILWMPATLYAPDHSTTVVVSGVTSGLCGASRPTHFAGVTTVVAKLFNAVQPTRAYFGEKDYQQLAAIRRMVRDLDMPVDVVGMPIVREPDGLAMSSRNVYLSTEERGAALSLRAALDAARQAFGAGTTEADHLRALLRARLERAPLVRVEYAEVVDATSLVPSEGAVGHDARLLVAARVGSTRLIDNDQVG